MTLETVIDSKTDKPEKNYQEYVHDKRTRTGHVSCVTPSFVTDNR